MIEFGQLSQLTQVNGFKVWLYFMPLMRRHSLWVKELCFTTAAISSVTQFKTRKKNWGMWVRCVECAKLVGRTLEHSIQFNSNWAECVAMQSPTILLTYVHVHSFNNVFNAIFITLFHFIYILVIYFPICIHSHPPCTIARHDQVIKSNEWLPFFSEFSHLIKNYFTNGHEIFWMFFL